LHVHQLRDQEKEDHDETGHGQIKPNRDRITDTQRHHPPPRSPPQQQFIGGRARSKPAEEKDNGKDDQVKSANDEQALATVHQQWIAWSKIKALYYSRKEIARRSAGNESTNANGAPAIASDHSKCTAEKTRVIPSGREGPRKRSKGQSRGPSVRAGLAFSLRMTTPASAETLFHR